MLSLWQPLIRQFSGWAAAVRDRGEAAVIEGLLWPHASRKQPYLKSSSSILIFSGSIRALVWQKQETMTAHSTKARSSHGSRRTERVRKSLFTHSRKEPAPEQEPPFVTLMNSAHLNPGCIYSMLLLRCSLVQVRFICHVQRTASTAITFRE